MPYYLETHTSLIEADDEHAAAQKIIGNPIGLALQRMQGWSSSLERGVQSDA
jgi:hypothetical protein